MMVYVATVFHRQSVQQRVFADFDAAFQWVQVDCDLVFSYYERPNKWVYDRNGERKKKYRLGYIERMQVVGNV